MSKLDEAFLKAYAKGRGAVTPSEPEVMDDQTVEEMDSEIWIDTDGRRMVRRDDGVMNVASFIARSADGRSRGAAASQGGSDESPENAAWMSLPAGSPETTAPLSESGSAPFCFDAGHSLRGPHFQPISLDLAAFDLFTQPGLVETEPMPSREPATKGDPQSGVSRPVASQPVAPPAIEAVETPATQLDAKTMRIDLAEPAAPAAPAAPVVDEPVQPTRVDFQAVWEVDRFEFEEIVEELCEESSPLWEAARQLRTACDEGLKVLAVTSPLREQGRSTLAITLARMVAASGLNVALLDGDMDRPALADKLSLEIRLGWGDAIRTGLPTEEVAVHSVADRFTVLPLAAPGADKEGRPAAAATSAMLTGLTAAFDLVIIDTSNINVIGGWIPGSDSPCQIDAAMVIADTRHEDPEAQQACIRRLQKLGIENVGIVENFAD